MAGNGSTKRNLKRGGSPGRPKTTPEDKEVRRISKRLVMDAAYQKTLLARMKDGSLHPSVQCMLWYFAFGKPAETIETKQPTPIRLVHEYATVKDKKDE